MFKSPSSSQRSMCFGRGPSSALTVPTVRQPFACGREETRSSRSRIGGAPRRGFVYGSRHGFGLPLKPSDLQARLTQEPARRLSLHALASCRGQRARGSANRKAVTAVLRTTNKTLSQLRRLLSCP
jgi:hypothetical protein